MEGMSFKMNMSQNFVKRIFRKNDEEIKMDLFNNNDYIEWLINFTNRFPAWRNDMADYGTLNISNNDKKNMDKLKYFFESLNNYAYKSGIKNYSYGKEIFYYIKINNFGLQIGKINTSDCSYYCQRQIIMDKFFIDFGNIKIQQNVEEIYNYEKDLRDFEKMIIELHYKNIPLSVIEDTTKRVLKKIRNDGGYGKNGY